MMPPDIIFILFFSLLETFAKQPSVCHKKTFFNAVATVGFSAFVGVLPIEAQNLGESFDGLVDLRCQKTALTGMSRLGAGGGGTTFSGMIGGNVPDSVAKISWERSKQSVENECKVLKYLEKYHVDHVEKCVALCDGSGSIPSSRSVAVMTPLFTAEKGTSPVATLGAIGKSSDSLRRAMVALISTTVQMVKAGVALSDVQLLIDPLQGNLLFIDMTEGKIFESPTPSYLDMQLARSFMSESLIFAQEVVDSGDISQLELDALLRKEILRALGRSDHTASVVQYKAILPEPPQVDTTTSPQIMQLLQEFLP